jgi:hypothetical protein
MRRPRQKLADDVYAKAKANPAKFGELAKEFSKDPVPRNKAAISAASPWRNGEAVRGCGVLRWGGRTRRRSCRFRLAHHQGQRCAPVYAAVRGSQGQIERVEEQKAAQKFATSADQFQNLRMSKRTA